MEQNPPVNPTPLKIMPDVDGKYSVVDTETGEIIWTGSRDDSDGIRMAFQNHKSLASQLADVDKSDGKFDYGSVI